MLLITFFVSSFYPGDMNRMNWHMANRCFEFGTNLHGHPSMHNPLSGLSTNKGMAH